MSTTIKVRPQKAQNHIQITSQIAPLLTKLAYFLADKFIFPWFFGKIKITGKENVPKDGAVIIAPTHRSRWDALMVPYATGRMTSGRDPHFMVSANEIKGIQGWLIRRGGGFPVDPKRPGMDSLRHSIDLLSQEHMVVIFPEGNIFRTDEVKPLKRGIAKIALEVESQNPQVAIKILPVSIKYSKAVPTRGSNVSIHIGACIDVSNYQGSSERENSFRLTDDLHQSLQKIHSQNQMDVE